MMMMMMMTTMLQHRKEPCNRWGAHRHHLANATEQLVRGGGAASRQINLTACFTEVLTARLRTLQERLVVGNAESEFAKRSVQLTEYLTIYHNVIILKFIVRSTHNSSAVEWCIYT